MTAGQATGPARARPRLSEAVVDEIPAIARLPDLTSASEALIERDLVADGSDALVARHAGAVVGYASATLQYDEAHVTDVAVDPAWRRRGIATALVEALCRRMHGRGVSAFTLEVRAGNVAAQGLYRRLGFVAEGRRPGYYPDGEDALILWRRDRPDGSGPAVTAAGAGPDTGDHPEET